MEWSESVLPAGNSITVPVAVRTGVEYLVLARTVQDCDVDLVINEEVKDRSPSSDAKLEFQTPEEGQLGVGVLTYSDIYESCLVGMGVYQR